MSIKHYVKHYVVTFARSVAVFLREAFRNTNPYTGHKHYVKIYVVPFVRSVAVFLREAFTPTKNSDKFVVIDGSNVAWDTVRDKEKGDKPSAKNIKLVVDYALKNKGFKEIIVIVDAALYHQIEDKNIFDELKKEGILKEAPAKTDADYFIIKYAMEKSAFIVTNDTFKRDWKGKNTQISEYIDKYRVPFMIIGNTVEFYEKN